MSVAGARAIARAEPRLALFLLGPRVIDFDTFLPTALELKEQRPAWTIRFVTFSRENYDFILRNHSMRSALDGQGTLHYLGSRDASGWPRRAARKLRALTRLSLWTLGRRRPILFMSRPFAKMPYSLIYTLARLRGGRGYLLWKSRSPDQVHHIVWQNRKPPAVQPRSLISRLIGRDVDGVIDYHGEQDANVGLSERFGRIAGAPKRRIGFPHLFPAWRRFIVAESRRERERLAAEGVPEDAELYAMFAAKPWSSVNLRDEGSVERSFLQAIAVLLRRRPRAVVLIRPHPKALDEPYIRYAIESAGLGRARLSLAHPEVLLALARRAIFNNPSNIMFSCLDGRLIDVSDYAPRHYAEWGEVSLAHGYGPLFVNPRAADFEARLARAIEDDGAFEPDELHRKRDALLGANPADLGPLLALVEADGARP
ncbi:MAG: hypothetical protein ACREGL_04045, partial [Alphaproteobacteria bacterium]